MYLCMDCCEPYDRRFLDPIKYGGKIEYICPKESCEGDVIELDELIAPTIIKLNKKGYHTQYCCSGHWYSEHSTPYIYFHKDCEPPTCPESFSFEDTPDDTGKVIRAKYVSSGSIKYDFVIEVNKQLLQWAEALPDIEEIHEQ